MSNVCIVYLLQTFISTLESSRFDHLGPPLLTNFYLKITNNGVGFERTFYLFNPPPCLIDYYDLMNECVSVCACVWFSPIEKRSKCYLQIVSNRYLIDAPLNFDSTWIIYIASASSEWKPISILVFSKSIHTFSWRSDLIYDVSPSISPSPSRCLFFHFCCSFEESIVYLFGGSLTSTIYHINIYTKERKKMMKSHQPTHTLLIVYRIIFSVHAVNAGAFVWSLNIKSEKKFDHLTEIRWTQNENYRIFQFLFLIWWKKERIV